MRCLAALARWEELNNLCKEYWTPAEPAARLEMAPMVNFHIPYKDHNAPLGNQFSECCFSWYDFRRRMQRGTWVSGIRWQNMFPGWMMVMKANFGFWEILLLQVMAAVMGLFLGPFYRFAVGRYSFPFCSSTLCVVTVSWFLRDLIFCSSIIVWWSTRVRGENKKMLGNRACCFG